MEGLIYFLILAALALFVLLEWYIAKEFHNIAKMKGHWEKKYFWWCFWLGAVGWLMVIALPERKSAEPVGDDIPEL